MKNLFDFNAGGSSSEEALSINSFLGKLEKIEKDYKSILGEETIEFVGTLVVEYNRMLAFHKKIDKLFEEEYKVLSENKAFAQKVKNLDREYIKKYFIKNALGLADKYSDSTYDIDARLTANLGQLRGVIEDYILEKWSIKYDFSKSFQVEEITEDVIFEEIFKATNNGNFDQIRIDQLHKEIRKNLISKDNKLAKEKITFGRFSYSEKCRFMKRWESRSSYEKIDTLVKTFIDCFKLPENEVSHIKFYCNKRNEEDGAFDEYTFYSSIIEKLKLLKNGKLEISFKKQDDALKYFNDYINPNMEK